MLAGILAGRMWARSGSRAAAWAAGAFGTLAVVVVAGRLLPSDPDGANAVLQRALIALLVLFPYLLYRFTTAFVVATRRLERLVGLFTFAMVAWSFSLPTIPDTGQPRPAVFDAYLAAFLVHWTLLTIVAAVRLWRAGHGQPSVPATRMRLLSVAGVAITFALYLEVPSSSSHSWLALVGGCVGTVAAAAFALALDPPAAVRALWRRPEEQRVQAAIAGLLRAETEQDVVDGVLPPMSRIVGAAAVELVAPDARTIGSCGLLPNVPAAHRLELGDATLHVWTGPVTPLFGSEELKLLQTLGSLTALALDRARLLGREREARAQLEQADELKTQFVSNAAHELRNPITTVVGLIETLERRGAELPEPTRVELRETLGAQARRLRTLVDQLLDLSRLDAEAVEIRPEWVDVRAFAADVVEAVTGGSARQIELAIAPGLAAEVDRNALALILTNLVTNALRYGAPPISIGAATTDHSFCLTVEDAGVGVPPSFVPKLFERFARGNEAQSVHGGSGLGLAIARAYARAHRGDLVYAPDRRGARFELVLPR